ncbi:hypothetical protein K490DRAFT_68755 [Saccharata proteae CBS 121410]|uniref:Box C/D snoRNA protein 1 n=1 Tax=Saccharata proteae CBS 121410 TaxID=1314787 RepID=A0A9P4HPU6_9PEZI|nr:hypothetical protein K490DRAFT_68755 [Saccharata proteae CBS 121410]
MADDETALLTELCAICNTSPPKYRCPRCQVRTCSLKCVQRHKQWAQCSGKRDQTAYVRKSELATPAGVDRDYNFLSGIERAFDTADRHADRRGITVDDASAARKGQQKWAQLQSYLRANRIAVDRAPRGLSRQKANCTRLSKGGRVIWTVEWILDDGLRALSEASESATVAAAYANMLRLRRNASTKRKRQAEDALSDASSKKPGAGSTGTGTGTGIGTDQEKTQTQTQTPKTSRVSDVGALPQHQHQHQQQHPNGSGTTGTAADVQPLPSDSSNAAERNTSREPQTADNAVPMPASVGVPKNPDPETPAAASPNPDRDHDHDHDHDHPVSVSVSINTPVKLSGQDIDPNVSADAVRQSKSVVPAADNDDDDALAREANDPAAITTSAVSFYLVRPHTPASQPRVLIPVPASSSLTAALTDKLVLEFPTFIALPSSSPLPDTVMLEADYLHQTQQDAHDLDQLLKHEAVTERYVAQEGEAEEEGELRGPAEHVDEGMVLEVLRRDFGAGGSL